MTINRFYRAMIRRGNDLSFSPNGVEYIKYGGSETGQVRAKVIVRHL